jgi:hypothetical protein
MAKLDTEHQRALIAEEKKAAARRQAFKKRGYKTGYGDQAGVKRAGSRSYMDRPETAHQPGFESTGKDNTGSRQAK